MRRFLSVLFLAVSLGAAVVPSSFAATQVDALIKKLEEKGILTKKEGIELKGEIAADEKMAREEGLKQSLPDWVQNTKLKGDFRLRYQYDHTVNTTNSQNRARARVRLGVESKINDITEVGIGLATGKSDLSTVDKDTARSTNQTLTNAFSKHAINLDYAYAKIAAAPWVSLIGGKFKNVLWEPGDLLWDTDINPEGGAVMFSKNLGSKTTLFANSGVYLLEEVSAQNDDPLLSVFQSGINFDATSKLSLKGAVSYYAASNIKGRTIPGTVSTNTLKSSVLQSTYDTITPAMEVTIKEPFKALDVRLLDIQQIGFFGEFVNNPQRADKNNGYMVGTKFGDAKVSTRGAWQFQYNYAQLEKDAVLDILPDSDRFGGKTNMRSHEGILTYGIGKNSSLGVDYYYGWNMAASHRTPAHVLQADWNLKF